MPTWQPNWSDVSFDHAAAQQAIAALRSMATLLDTTTDARVRLAAEAQRDWAGRSRIAFDAELARTTRQAADLAAACRAAAASIEAAAEDARIEQRRRDLDRERWSDERRREDRVRATSGPRPI
jgi:uncharacterized protein YukE